MRFQETPVLPKPTPTSQVPKVLRFFLGAIVLWFVVTRFCQPFIETGGWNKITEAPPGDDPSHFDPIGTISEVQAFAGDEAQLVSMSATNVASDGTLNLTADGYYSSVSYTFVREVPAPEVELPVGAGGSLSGHYYQEIEIYIFRPGQWRSVSGTNSYTYVNKGMEKDEDDPIGTASVTIPLPACSFATLWEQVVADGIPINAVASIAYDADGYDFNLSELNYYTQFDRECEKIGE